MKVVTYRCDMCGKSLDGPMSTATLKLWEGRRYIITYHLCAEHNDIVHDYLSRAMIDGSL